MISRFRQLDTHRLIPSEYSEHPKRIYKRIADGVNWRNIYNLQYATDNRVSIVTTGKRDPALNIGPDELIHRVPFFWIINGAFTIAGNHGMRFNNNKRGAWYAGFDFNTSIKEISYHIRKAEIDTIKREGKLTRFYDDYMADFSGEYDDIRRNGPPRNRGRCLTRHLNYRASQNFAAQLLSRESPGLVYPSVRDGGGYCIACFRPALVDNIRRHARYRITWKNGRKHPYVILDELYSSRNHTLD